MAKIDPEIYINLKKMIYAIIKLLFTRTKVTHLKSLNRGLLLKIIWATFEEDYIWSKHYDR